ncbi:Calcium-binding mitochondrial carrier protein Aralar2 [Golovinomyces cichoracearum]|uniref:Mitochondrial aspartate-glutamate transporter AGC1 n=1 Tax=Golovinomyces cichoracearum TaxID=62708 RepID=A0A420IIM5_9PEZI|nr:Calcium-binding mitochondrial carrier protein Aralar2 [Golovinomyces cichoracearum]
MKNVARASDVVKENLLGSETHVNSKLSSLSKATFEKYAKQDPETGELYMGENEFTEAIAPKSGDYLKIKREQYAILFYVADRNHTGKLNINDWGTFENLLAKPDAEYEIAFRLFDVQQEGTVKYNDLKKLYEINKGTESIPFDWDCEWARLYTGGKKRRHELTYPQFCQMLRGLQGERIRQAFNFFDKNGDGYIEPEEFQRIILQTSRHKLSDHLLENIPTLCNISKGSKISYANVRAFQNIIQEIDLVEIIIRKATANSSDGKITRTDFLNHAARTTRYSHFTPMETDILFHFASLDEPSGRLSMADFAKVFDPSWRALHSVLSEAAEASITKAGKSKNILYSIFESVHHFALGSIAGAFGAFMVYPIDLVKTRMQNQRSSTVGQMLYKNSIDCAKKVVSNEGFKGLYSGILPQLVGVAPEKAIKLTVNDLMRSHFSGSDGKIRIHQELLSGGTAGACQVIFTNPLEIVKIRLQVQGEVAKTINSAPRRSAVWIIRNLGLVGLYKGASACLLRDVPFSAIYFTSYNHLKRDYFGESPTKSLSILQLLAAGAVAGMPASYLTTPCDVIKTRLQVEARKGEASYTSLRHCVKTIYQQEGFKAFYKGGPARVLRSSPQFGFTLAVYELLQKFLPMPAAKDSIPQTNSTISSHSSKEESLNYLRSRNALKIILDIDEDFGKARIPGQKTWLGLPKIIGGGGDSNHI